MEDLFGKTLQSLFPFISKKVDDEWRSSFVGRDLKRKKF